MKTLNESENEEFIFFWGNNNTILKMNTQNFLKLKPSKTVISNLEQKVENKKLLVGIIEPEIIENMMRICQSDVDLAQELFAGMLNGNKDNTDKFIADLVKKNES